MLLTGARAISQVTITSSDSLNCGVTCTNLTAHVVGDVPINAGITVDDRYSPLQNIGFTFNFYGVNYNQLVIAANGGINFNASDAGAYDPYVIDAPLLGNTSRLNQICGPWVDIDITAGSASGTITYSLDGVAPYRKYVLTYCAPNMYSCTSQKTTSQIIIYETTNIIEVHIARKPVCAGWNGGYAIIGVQNAAGTVATVAPGRDYPAVYTCTNEAWRFTPSGGGTTYTVAPILYATVPLASSLVYWYNVNTGAYLGTGTTINVCPTVNTTYKAGAKGCADTSFAFYTVTTSATGPTVTLTYADPSQCGINDGTIVLHGLGAGMNDTVNYMLNGVPQPPIYTTVDGSGNITLSNLAPGVYSNFIVKQLTCYSLPAGPITITYPPITMTVATTDPTTCGGTDGSIVLSGLYASHTYTVTYNKAGVPQPAINTTSSPAGVITISGLPLGTYTNIIASFGACATPPMGPYTLANPPIAISSVTPTDPTRCGLNDGKLVLAGLYPNHAFTVTYNWNGVAQPAVSVTSSATGTITLINLCGGTYANIIARFGDCITPPAGPVTLNNPPIGISSIDPVPPSFCGKGDGSLTLNGLYPNQLYLIRYNFNGVPQPPVTQISSPTGTITLTNLFAGTYSNIIASFANCSADCVTPAAGPITLNNPATPPLNILSFTNPTQCGYCNGEIVISALTPFTTDTVRFFKDGTSFSPYYTVTQSDSTVHVPNLCRGAYDNFTISIGECVYNVSGSANLVTNPIEAQFDTTVHKGCKGDTVRFFNTSFTLPAATLYYRWDFGDGTSDTTASPVHVFGTGVYTVTLLATNHFCDDIATVVIDLSHPLQAEFIDTPNILCQGQTVTYVNSSITSSPATYLWNFGEGPLSDSVNGTHTFNTMGTYTVTLVATDAIPCRDSVQHVIYVDTSGGIELRATDTVICQGTKMTFEGIYSPFGSTGITWGFGDGDSVNNINPIEHAYHAPGTYTVTVNALYRACDNLVTSRNVIVYPQPHVDLGDDMSICPGSEAVVLKAQDQDDVNTTYLWNTGETTRTINITEPGSYYVNAHVSGCNSTDTIIVANDCYMSLPNVFTPNGDGVNDYFFPRQMLTKGLTAFHMTIFNRWGQLLFETKTLDGRGWDGRFNDVEQPQGVYIYSIDATFKDGQKEHHQGNVTLLK